MRFLPSLLILLMTSAIVTAADPAIIPRPSSLELGHGTLRIDQGERIIVTDATRATGEYLADLLAPAIGARRNVVSGVDDDSNHGDIILLVANRPDLGDEGKKDRWKECPDYQARMKAARLKNEEELQSHVIKRISTFLATKGKRTIGWDEIEQGGLAPRGSGDELARGEAGDHRGNGGARRRDDADAELLFGLLPVEGEGPAEGDWRVFADRKSLCTRDRQTDYMAFPRACAVAEVCWTPMNRRDFVDFSARLPTHLKRLDALGVHYFTEPATQP